MATLALAGEWHCKPWEIYGIEPTPWERWRWIIRAREWMVQRAKKDGGK